MRPMSLRTLAPAGTWSSAACACAARGAGCQMAGFVRSTMGEREKSAIAAIASTGTVARDAMASQCCRPRRARTMPSMAAANTIGMSTAS